MSKLPTVSLLTANCRLFLLLFFSVVNRDQSVFLGKSNDVVNAELHIDR